MLAEVKKCFCDGAAMKIGLIKLYLFQILNHSKLHTTLIATSVEIVIYSFGTPHNFPWVLQTLNIDAFYFYKIIEIVVQCYEGILTRDLIKHLNAVRTNTKLNLIIQRISNFFNIFSTNIFRSKNNVLSRWHGKVHHHCGMPFVII